MLWLRAMGVFAALNIVGLCAYLVATLSQFPDLIETMTFVAWMVGLAGVIGLTIADVAVTLYQFIRRKLRPE